MDPVFLYSSSIERPSISRIIPPIDNGAEIDMVKIESSKMIRLAPNAIQTQAEITTLSRRLETPLRTPMLAGRRGWISALSRGLAMCRVQVGDGLAGSPPK